MSITLDDGLPMTGRGVGDGRRREGGKRETDEESIALVFYQLKKNTINVEVCIRVDGLG